MRNKKNKLFSRILNNQKGVSAILVAIVLPVLLGFTALAIDVGYMYATKNELQNIADAAALAGAGELGKIYLDMDPKDHTGYTLTDSGKIQIHGAAIAVAALNKHANEDGFTIPEANGLSDDISIGIWNWNLKKLDQTFEEPDAVQVTVRRNASSIHGSVTTFFARIFAIFGGSHETFESSAIATAALSNIGFVDEGVLNVPLAISENHSCGPGTLHLNPPADSCMGWHNFLDDMNSSNLVEKLYKIIKGFGPDPDGGKSEGELWLETYFKSFYDSNEFDKLDSNYISEGASILESLEQQGGTISALLNGDWYKTWNSIDNPLDPSKTDNNGDPDLKSPIPFLTLFDFFRFRDGDGSGNDTVIFNKGAVDEEVVKADDVWTATMPIYQDSTIDGCSQSNNTKTGPIVGFAKVLIRVKNRDTSPNGIDADQIEIYYDCDHIYESGRGSGNDLGNVKGSLPNLVQ